MLPDLIEIVPLTAPVKAEITVPGSKSITNRALILAALADGEVILRGALWSEDTQIMVECLKELGFAVNVAADPDETCNRTITVAGQGGRVPAGGTETQPLELFVGNAGTAARFLSPFLCLGSGVYRLHGVPRMHERPQAALFAALRELGYRVEAEAHNDKLPARIYGGSSRGNEAQTKNEKTGQSLLTSAATKKCRVSIEESSQFASALLLSAGVGGWQVEIAGENEDESPYVAMTSIIVDTFPRKGGVFQIEPDASSGSYFWAAGWLIHILTRHVVNPGRYADWIGSPVFVKNWPETGWQIDADFPEFLPFPKMISRTNQLGDSIMTAIVLAVDRDIAHGMGYTSYYDSIQFTELGRLRIQECERVVALRTELTKCGAKIVEVGDTLTAYPREPEDLHGAEIETYNDHRMAMCFAVLGLKVPGIKIKNPACVKKTFPNFFQKLAAQPPHGLGAEIWEIKNGQRTRKLSGDDLFAD
ncbi:MAG: 3-phosphoshikimate 1-carboxyvinyltransferase [Verrucomicrobiae bacterium]|nr:3-phosphoshikimate 1-carboxyvinyltransferase [Verrucomicrobiae bacterium]